MESQTRSPECFLVGVHCSSGIVHHRYCVGCGFVNPDYVPGNKPTLERQTHVVCECGRVAASYDHSFCRDCGCSYFTCGGRRRTA